MAKVIIAAIINSFSTDNDYIIDDTTLVESIDEMNTFIRDNRDDTLNITFDFFFTSNPELNYHSTIGEQMDGIEQGVEIAYTTALLVLHNKGL